MSHFTTIHTQIRDLDALAEACAELGVALEPDATCRGYGRLLRKAPHVIRLKGPRDIVIARHRRKPADFDTVALARASDQYTGAEIEAVFIDALHEAYAEGREPLPRDILDAMSNTVPIAQLMDGRIAALRHWAKGRAREAGVKTGAAPRHGRRVGVVNGMENDN